MQFYSGTDFFSIEQAASCAKRGLFKPQILAITCAGGGHVVAKEGADDPYKEKNPRVVKSVLEKTTEFAVIGYVYDILNVYLDSC